MQDCVHTNPVGVVWHTKVNVITPVKVEIWVPGDLEVDN